MGIYDREYYRQERTGFSLAWPRSAVAMLVLANVAVYLAEMVANEPRSNVVVEWLSAYVWTLKYPWMWWQFVTYGFVHDTQSLQHLAFNMLTFWFLGRDVEAWYGTKEFTRLYFVLLVVGSVTWAVVNAFGPSMAGGPLFGASGAVVGVVVLYALIFPRRMLYVMFVLPMPAWAVGAFFVAQDMLGAMGWEIFGGAGRAANVHVAYAVHLAGAAFAFVYFRRRWNFGRMLGGRFRIRWPIRSKPTLHVHQPDEDESLPEGVAEEEVDRILDKIHREGESSLTRKERRVLEEASREYQRRRRSDT